MKIKGKTEATLIVITAMVAAQVLHETLDELRETSFYKHRLKNLTNQFQQELTKECNRTIQELYKTDDHTMMCLQECIHEIAQKLATIHPTKLEDVRDCIRNI